MSASRVKMVEAPILKWKLEDVNEAASQESASKQNLAKTCMHEVAVPNCYTSTNDESLHGTLSIPLYNVLVSAHKTAIAKYAIAMSFRDKQKVIYTSPLKALSNQKYKELSEEFSDVDLLTGDVTISPNASCLVMTTEVLRAMLYAGSQPCHMVYTDFRPTPLQHYVFPMGGSGLYLVVDDNDQFREDNFLKLQDTFIRKKSGSSNAKASGRSGKECEEHAMCMTKLDFNTEEEKEAVEQVLHSVVACLSEEDRCLPAIELMLLLQRGIVVHHSGLLPVIKELVELLFQ
ncbi:hypothetical protein CQW23_07185 [Capsicum baccatum]|uniref:Uncharacterized protein n=1 Tax=Capsicum baccatum TaxID=33114 RepID=A0A2G2X5J0_CAPBA|nr:hypothetical protein CQW23_07185 [Capsicum baccatum]